MYIFILLILLYLSDVCDDSWNVEKCVYDIDISYFYDIYQDLKYYFEDSHIYQR